MSNDIMKALWADQEKAMSRDVEQRKASELEAEELMKSVAKCYKVGQVKQRMKRGRDKSKKRKQLLQHEKALALREKQAAATRRIK